MFYLIRYSKITYVLLNTLQLDNLCFTEYVTFVFPRAKVMTDAFISRLHIFQLNRNNMMYLFLAVDSAALANIKNLFSSGVSAVLCPFRRIMLKSVKQSVVNCKL